MAVALRADHGVQLRGGCFSDLDEISFRGMIGANWDQSGFRREGRRKQTARIVAWRVVCRPEKANKWEVVMRESG